MFFAKLPPVWICAEIKYLFHKLKLTLVEMKVNFEIILAARKLIFYAIKL